MERDYTDRCGNCHQYMRPKDKYCRNCGTERGKGKFEPFENTVDIMYGPQVKVKYKCSECGHIWITGALGGSYSEYCPRCGKGKIRLQQQDASDALFGYIGVLEPFDEAERPVLLTEEQITSLACRKKKDNLFSDSDLIKLLAECKIAIPDRDEDDFSYNMTEAEGERLTLVSRIACMSGRDPKGYRGMSCPNCKSECIAAIGHDIWNPDFCGVIDSCVCVDGGTKDAMVYRYGANWRLGQDKPSEKFPAYMCLSCGRRFGLFDVPESWKQEYEKKQMRETE